MEIIKDRDLRSAIVWFILATSTYLVSSQEQVSQLLDVFGMSREAATAVAVSLAGFAQIIVRKIKNEMANKG